MHPNSNFKDDKLEYKIQEKANMEIFKTQSQSSPVQIDNTQHSQAIEYKLDERNASLNYKISPQNTISFNSILPNDSLLSLLLRPNISILEIFAHADFGSTLEQSNNSLIEKLAHHAADVISSDQKEISYMFFPPKEKIAKIKLNETFQNLYLHKDQLLVPVASPNESDKSLTSPNLNKICEQINQYKQQSSFFEDVPVEPNNQKLSNQKRKLYVQKQTISSSQQSNLLLLSEDYGDQENQTDFLYQFLSLIFDFKTTSNSISISYFYQVFVNFFNRNMKEMEYYIFEKIPSFCDRLVCLVDDQTIMDLILLVLNQPKQEQEADAASQSSITKGFLQNRDQNEEDIRNEYYFKRKCDLIEGLFDNLQQNYQSQQIQKNINQICKNFEWSNNADASSTFSSSQNIDETLKQSYKSNNEQQNLEQDILFWKMKNSSMIICEILDNFQDINRGEDLAFLILNYHSQKVFQSLASNNIDEISFNCDVAQHLLAFLQNEDIQFRIEFGILLSIKRKIKNLNFISISLEAVKGNKIVEKYFKESITSIKRELNLAQILKRVKLVNYIISNSEIPTRRVVNPTTHVTKLIQKSYIGHLKKLAEILVKCIEQNSHYECWTEDQNKWNDLNKLVKDHQKILKGKLGEEEQPPKQKFQLNYSAKQSLLNRRKQILEGKKESEKQNVARNSSKNQDVFQRLNSPIKKTITLQVGTPKQKPSLVEDEEIRESVSSLQSKKEQQQQQALSKISLDSPMLKSKNQTPKLGSNCSLSNSSSSLGIRTPKTPVLSTPTRVIQNTPATPNMKKIFLSSPMKKPDQLKNLDLLDQIKLSNEGSDQNSSENRGRKKNRKRSSQSYNSFQNDEDDLDSLNSSNSSASSVDSQKSRSSSNGNCEKNQGWKYKPKEFHKYLLKDLDSISFEDQNQVFTQKHSIKINEVGFSFLNKKEKKLFDWNQKAEDEEEELKQVYKQEECFKKLLQEQQKEPILNNLFNLEAAAAIQQKREIFSNMTNFTNQNLENDKTSAFSSPNKCNLTPQTSQENYKKNSIDETSSPRVLKENPQMKIIQENTLYKSQNLHKKNYNDSPCIEVNKQYFGYLVRDKIRKFSYDTQVDPIIKQDQAQSTNQVKSCPQSQSHKLLLQMSNDHEKGKGNFMSLLPMKQIQRSRESRHSFDLNFLQINGQYKNSIYKNDIVKSVESLNTQKQNQVNSKLIKKVRDKLDNSDDSSHQLKSKECLSDEKLSLNSIEKPNTGYFQSEISSEDEKTQQRSVFLERKQTKKKSTFFLQTKEIKIMNQSNFANQKIDEELQQLSSNQFVSDDPLNGIKTTFSKKNVFSQQSSEEKILNKKIKSKVHNMNFDTQDKDSYGDLEDTSPLVKRSITSKVSAGSEKKIKSNKSNKSNKNSQQNTEQIQQQNNLTSSQTSIQDRLESNFNDDQDEFSLLKKCDDFIFLNLISGDEQIAQKNSNWQMTIASTIMQKSQRMQKSLFSKTSNSQLCSPNIIKSEDKSECFLFNNENNQCKLSSSSSSLISLQVQNNQTDIGSNIYNKLQLQNKCEIELEKIPRSNSNTNLDIITNYTNEKENQTFDQNEEDLILKIILKQQQKDDNLSNISQALKYDDEQQIVQNFPQQSHQ